MTKAQAFDIMYIEGKEKGEMNMFKLLVALEIISILFFIFMMFIMTLVFFGVEWAEKINEKYFE